MKSLKWIIPIVIVTILLGAGVYTIYRTQTAVEQILPTQSPRNNFPTQEASPSLQVKGIAPPNNQPATGPEDGLEVKNVGIKVENLNSNVKISSPLTIKGTANVTSQTVIVSVKDANGKILGTGQATACIGLDACDFQTQIAFSNPTTSAGFVEVYSPSTIDSSPTFLQTIPITF